MLVVTGEFVLSLVSLVAGEFVLSLLSSEAICMGAQHIFSYGKFVICFRLHVQGGVGSLRVASLAS